MAVLANTNGRNSHGQIVLRDPPCVHTAGLGAGADSGVGAGCPRHATKPWSQVLADPQGSSVLGVSRHIHLPARPGS